MTTRFKNSERAVDSREHLLFPENFEQMIQARSGIAAGNGETRRMDERADFDAQICRSRLQCRFDLVGVEILQRRASASRTACKRGLFSAVKCLATPSGLQLDLIDKIETAIRRQLIKCVDLAFASFQCGPDVICGKFFRSNARRFQCSDAQFVKFAQSLNSRAYSPFNQCNLSGSKVA